MPYPIEKSIAIVYINSPPSTIKSIDHFLMALFEFYIAIPSPVNYSCHLTSHPIISLHVTKHEHYTSLVRTTKLDSFKTTLLLQCHLNGHWSYEYGNDIIK